MNHRVCKLKIDFLLKNHILLLVSTFVDYKNSYLFPEKTSLLCNTLKD